MISLPKGGRALLAVQDCATESSSYNEVRPAALEDYVRILLIHPTGFEQVQGATEAYYVTQYLRRNHVLTCLVGGRKFEKALRQSCTPSLEKARVCHYEIKRIRMRRRIFPYWVSFDVRAAAKLLFGICKRFDLLYTYKGVLLTPLLAKSLFKSIWVCDLRSAPIEQEREFLGLAGKLTLLKRLYLKGLKRAYHWSLSYADMVITLSPHLFELLCEEYRVNRDRIFLLPLGVDQNLFRSKLDNPPSDVGELIVVSSIGPQRGFETILRAVAILAEMGEVVHLKIVGSGPDAVMHSLKQMAEQLKIHHLIEWLGRREHVEIPGLLEKAGIALCILPDIEAYRVASPTKILEYLSMGKAVIASDIPSNRALIRSGWNGLLVQADSPEALAEGIRRLRNDTSLRERLQTNARESVRDNDWEKLLLNLESRLIALVEHRVNRRKE